MPARTKSAYAKKRYGVVIGTRLTLARGEAFRKAAQLQHITPGQLLGEIVWRYLEEFAAVNNPRILFTKLEQVQLKLKELIAMARVDKVPMKAEKDAQASKEVVGSKSYQERQQKRSQMLEKGLTAFDDLFQIAKSETVAQQSRYRTQTYMVMARLGMLNALLLRNAAEEEVLLAIEELEKGNEEIDAMIDELEKKAKEKERQLSWGV